MMQFDIVTLFPDLFTPHLNNLPFKRAIEKELINVNLTNLRDFAIDKRGTVDDKPFGGGVGMILRIEPIYDALCSIYKTTDYTTENKKVILLSPQGKRFNQQKARELLNEKHITFICGRYEGIDARVSSFVTDTISIGDFVLSGGELPAITIMESIVRLIPGVLDKEAAIEKESFETGSLEHPQYTRPREFRNLNVPETLLSGNHKEIDNWKDKNSSKLD